MLSVLALTGIFFFVVVRKLCESKELSAGTKDVALMLTISLTDVGDDHFFFVSAYEIPSLGT